MEIRISAQRRPYIIRFIAADPADRYVSEYPLSSGELDRLLAHYPVKAAKPNWLELFNDQPSLRTIVIPATVGGGPAFERIDDGAIAEASLASRDARDDAEAWSTMRGYR